MLRLIVAVLSVLGIIFLSIGMLALRDTLSITNGAREASGTIIDMQGSVDSKGYPTYRPIVRFTPSNGDDVTFVSQISSSDAPTIGTTVAVLYKPARPKEAEISSFSALWLFPILFSGAGSLMLAVPLITGIVILRRRKRSARPKR